MRIACQDQQHIGDDFLRIVQVILVLSAEGEMRLCMATIKYAFHDMMTDLMPEGGRHSDWMIRRIHIYERFTDQNTITHVKTSQSATLGIVQRLGLQYGTQFRRNFRKTDEDPESEIPLWLSPGSAAPISAKISATWRLSKSLRSAFE